MSFVIPDEVRDAAKKALEFKAKGYKGGTETGINRAKQLAYDNTISLYDLAEMRKWFARHGPDAANGGTSYNGYVKWLEGGSLGRGAIAWLLWGGDDAYLWLKMRNIREALRKEFPDRKEASSVNNLRS